MSTIRLPVAPAFGEFDFESDDLGEDDSQSERASAISALRPAPIDDEPLRESREPFRVAVRDAAPQRTRVSDLPANIEEALTRAARSSFASPTQPPVERPSGVRISAPTSIEEAVLRVVESLEPLEALEREIPKA